MAENITANTVTAKSIQTDQMSADSITVGAASISGNTLTADKIILGGWTIFAQGEKLFATTPAGVDVQFEMIDYKLILGEQPTTPTDYVPPTITGTQTGFGPR